MVSDSSIVNNIKSLVIDIVVALMQISNGGHTISTMSEEYIRGYSDALTNIAEVINSRLEGKQGKPV